MHNSIFDREQILSLVHQAISDSPQIASLVKNYDKGELFFRQGQKIDHLYLMIDGEAMLEHERQNGSNLELVRVNNGHFAGLVAFTTGNLSLTTGIALKPSKVLCIKQADFVNNLGKYPTLQMPLQRLMLRNMADRFRTNVRLEAQMNSLNVELETESAQLKEAYKQLEDSHQRMVHQEKMATLGELVAGFAHEVNNPAAALLRSAEALKNNFISNDRSNPKIEMFQYGLETLPIGSNELRKKMAKITKKLDWATNRSQIRKLAQMPNQAIKLIEKNKKKIPVSEMIRQFEAGKFIHNIQVASERVANLVKSLKSYSRQDTNEWDMIDLRDGIKDTVLILTNRLKYMDLKLDLLDIPLTCGKMGELNQVWTNILVNACDVLEQGGKIRIKTRSHGEYKITVEISDNGPGIPPEIISRIFEPNFTTKNQGAKFGLGLGLAISNEIIRQHGGFIRCENREKRGARFLITLPVKSCEDTVEG